MPKSCRMLSHHLPVPFSRVMPLTTASVGPNTRTFNFSFLLEVQVSLSLLISSDENRLINYSVTIVNPGQCQDSKRFRRAKRDICILHETNSSRLGECGSLRPS